MVKLVTVLKIFEMETKKFEKLVAEAVATLPEQFQKKMENVNILVEDEPSRQLLKQQGIGQNNSLLGLYQGIPLKNRGVSYTNVLPDKIIIYQKPIERLCRNEKEIKEKVRAVFRHELGHHFGMSE